MNSILIQQFIKHFNKRTVIVATLNVIQSNKLSVTAAPRFSPINSDTALQYASFGPSSRNYTKLAIFLPASILSFLRPKSAEDEETPDDKLVMTIKRSILCIQRQQYDKAEQMLHLALRMAQDLQNKDGITYVFDVMANLAMETEQYKKAEKLFVNVMQRLLQDGYKEDDIKMLHISSKISHMQTLQGHLEKAEQGFKWTLGKIQERLKELKDDPDLLELCGLTKDCYAQLLMQMGHFMEAKSNFIEALNIYTQIHGRMNPEVASLLNNLAVVCTNLGELIAAEVYMTEALELAKEFPQIFETGVFQANQGMLRIQQGLLDQAKKICSAAWRLAKKTNSGDGLEQSNYCLEQLKKMNLI